MKKINDCLDTLSMNLYYKISKRRRGIWEKQVRRLYQRQSVEREAELEKKAEFFLVGQVKIILIGAVLIVLAGILLFGISFYTGEKDLKIKRNTYGSGDSQVMLDIKNEEGSTSLSFDISEQQPSEVELSEMYENFFIQLGKVIKGKNSSLNKVNQKINMPEMIDGYPFTIEYEIADSDYIEYDGSLGKAAAALRSGTLETKITATGSYQGESKRKSYLITIIPAEDDEASPLEQVINYIKSVEGETREENFIIISGKDVNASITRSGDKSKPAVLWILTIIVTVVIFVRRYSILKEKAEDNRESVIRDFPVIVHFISLYMGAGLSFSRTIERISLDYQEGITTIKSRYAFDQIVQLDIRMQMGMSQTEACEQWGKVMDQEEYQKLSMVLVQGMSKGSRELKYFLQQMEREAFRTQVDLVRKKGEEASTRMLLPMALLMLVVMILVMYPAIIQFQNY